MWQRSPILPLWGPPSAAISDLLACLSPIQSTEGLDVLALISALEFDSGELVSINEPGPIPGPKYKDFGLSFGACRPLR